MTMAIDAIWRALDAALVAVGSTLWGKSTPTDDPLERPQTAAAALYEYILDAVRPGSGLTQTVTGHDHGTDGPPISRGLVVGEDYGQSPLASFVPSNLNWYQERRIDADEVAPHDRQGGSMWIYEVSPSLPAGSHLVGRIYYAAANSDFEIVFEEAGVPRAAVGSLSTYKLPATGVNGDGSTGAWFDVPFVPLQSGVLNQLNLFARAIKYDAAKVPSLDLFGIYLWEVPESTTQLQGGVEL